MRNGMTARAIESAYTQTLMPKGVFVYVDCDLRGAAYSRQCALDGNPYEWTAFLDSDDWFLPNHLEVLATAQAETGADYVYSWYHLNDPANVHDPVFPVTHFTDPWDPAVPRQTTITVLVRTELAKTIGFWSPLPDERFPDGHRMGEDWLFTLGCNKLGKIFHVPQRTWVWSHHGANSSGTPGLGDAR